MHLKFYISVVQHSYAICCFKNEFTFFIIHQNSLFCPPISSPQKQSYLSNTPRIEFREYTASVYTTLKETFVVKGNMRVVFPQLQWVQHCNTTWLGASQIDLHTCEIQVTSTCIIPWPLQEHMSKDVKVMSISSGVLFLGFVLTG